MFRYEAVEVIAGLVTEEDLFVTSMGGLWDDCAGSGHPGHMSHDMPE